MAKRAAAIAAITVTAPVAIATVAVATPITIATIAVAAPVTITAIPIRIAVGIGITIGVRIAIPATRINADRVAWPVKAEATKADPHGHMDASLGLRGKAKSHDCQCSNCQKEFFHISLCT